MNPLLPTTRLRHVVQNHAHAATVAILQNTTGGWLDHEEFHVAYQVLFEILSSHMLRLVVRESSELVARLNDPGDN